MQDKQRKLLKIKLSRLLVRTLRTTILTLFVCGCLVSYFSYQWLKEIGVFHLQQTQIDFIKNYQSRDNTVFYDIHGKKFGELFRKYHIYKTYEQIPENLRNAIVAIEDRRFFQHPGYDVYGIGRIFYEFLVSAGHVRHGASTITQQVVRNLILSREKSVRRKLLEIAYAIELEKQLSKEKIFEIYANVLFLGNGAYGVGAAARRYFGKDLQDLSYHEAALIAGLFQSPSRLNPARYPEKAKMRQQKVLQALYEVGYLTKEDALAFNLKKLSYRSYKPLNQDVAPYFLDYAQQ